MVSFHKFPIKKSLSNLEYIKFKILITVLLIGYVRVLYFADFYRQSQEFLHLTMTLIGWITISTLTFYAFKNPKKTNFILHFGIVTTFAVILYTVFYIEQYFIIQIQSSFLIVIWSFYGLGQTWGIIYSLIFTFIFPFHTMTNGYHFHLFPEKIDSTYYFTWILFILNLIFIIYVPYLYQNAIKSILNKKAYLNKSLKESIDGNKDFTSVITHELKTPLNSVIGITNLLREKNINKEEKKELDVLHQKATYLLTLINKILEYNKLNLNLTKQDINKLDTIDLIDKILDNSKIEIEHKSFQIQKNFSPELSDKLIITESNRYSIAIKNLLEYFIRISPSKSNISINLTIEESMVDNTIILAFSIKNSLMNLDILNEQQFFEPFSKTEHQANEYTGLELSIAKKAIEQLNSKIEFYNTLKSGINLHFHLPIALEDKTIIEEKDVFQDKIIDLSKLNIITVDDNAINLLFMKSLLSHWNIAARTVPNGYEAISMVQNEHVDIILMDIHMPEISGFETSKRIRELENYVSQPYIIAVSAVNREDIESNLNKHGINDFLPKPINQNDLKQKLIEYYIKEL